MLLDIHFWNKHITYKKIYFGCGFLYIKKLITKKQNNKQ